jgi:hypothetical protein
MPSQSPIGGTANSILKQAQLKTPKSAPADTEPDIIDENNSEELN